MKYELKAFQLYQEIRDDPKVREIKGSNKLAFAFRLNTLCYEAEQQGLLDSISKSYVLKMLPERSYLSFRRLDKAIIDMRDARLETVFNEVDLKERVIELLKNGSSNIDIINMIKSLKEGDA